MRLALLLLLSLASPVLAASPVETARAHLKAGRLDDVLFALEGQTLPPEQQAPAADVLVSAGRASLAKKDAVLALQFTQMALRFKPDLPGAFEVAARAYLAEKEFTAAEDQAEKWLRTSKDAPEPRLLRAELAGEQAEWARVLELLPGDAPASLKRAEQARWRTLREEATRQEAEQKKARVELDAMEARLVAAQTAAADAPKGVEAKPGSDADARVILYRTSWCGVCKSASAFLKKRGVAFIEKDVEKDPGAGAELEVKKARAGIKRDAVPVTDFGGRLVQGFNPKLYAEQLKAMPAEGSEP